MYIRYLHYLCLTQFRDVYIYNIYKASFSPGSVVSPLELSLSLYIHLYTTAKLVLSCLFHYKNAVLRSGAQYTRTSLVFGIQVTNEVIEHEFGKNSFNNVWSQAQSGLGTKTY
jgi:hypothetical protein